MTTPNPALPEGQPAARPAPQLAPHVVRPLPGALGQRLVETLALAECPALTQRRARRSELAGALHDPIVWTRAAGVNVWDADDNRFVDLSAGFGAAGLGHGCPEVVAAVQLQAGRLLHALGDLHPSDTKVALLARLAALAPFPKARVMLGLSGSDAVTAALKTALLHTRKPGVLAFEGGYHGLEHGPLAACGYSAKMRAPFAPQLNPHVLFAPYPDASMTAADALLAVERAWGARDDVGAVLIEPVLGRGGVIAPPAGFLAGLRGLCERRGALLIADEVMTGLGRTGALFASVQQGAVPHVLCLGKALGGGVPVSACIADSSVMAAWGDPEGEALHTGTFFGNPLACAAALAMLDVLQRDDVCARSARTGAELLQQLRARVGSRVRDVRGVGLLIGVELSSSARALALGRSLLERGYITVPAASDARVISLTPPLVIDEAILAGFVAAFAAALEEAGA